MKHAHPIRTGTLLLLTFLTSMSANAQKKVLVHQTYLPNLSYESVMDMNSTTVLRYYDEQQTPALFVTADTTTSSSYISSMTRTGSENSDGDVPLAIAYLKMIMIDSESDTPTTMPKDAVLHGVWKKTHLQLDSISSDSLTSLKEYKMRQTLQGFYTQLKQQDIEVKLGEKTPLNRTLEFPTSKGTVTVNYQFVYELMKVEGNVATISLVIAGDLPVMPDASMKAISISGTGTLLYDIKNQSIQNSTINMRVQSSNSRNNVGMELQMDIEMNVSHKILN